MDELLRSAENSNMPIFHLYAPGMFLAIFLIAAYMTLRLTGRIHLYCFSAFVSAGCAVLNPIFVRGLLWAFGVPPITGWAPQPLVFVCLLAAIIFGHRALNRINRSPTPLRGRVLAWIGLVVGYAALLSIVGFLIWFIWGMGQF